MADKDGGRTQLDFLSGGGDMGALMRAHDWATSSLGNPALWPQPLRTAVRLLLTSGHPMYIWWGPDGACLYNDAYRQSIGPERHPGSLGRPAREVWDEIWDIIGPQIEQVMAGRGPTWHENQLVPITRNGRREDVFWTYSYSPIDDESAPNGVGGVLVICAETTQQVLAERRLAQMFEQGPSFMAMLEGPEHRIALANSAYLKLVGNRDVVGKTIAEALPDAVEQGYLELLDQVYRSGKPFSSIGAKYAVEVVHGGPIDERFVDFIYQPITDARGNVAGIFVEGSDVTGRKNAEDALHELNRTLETTVEERTREVRRAEEALRQAQKMDAIGQLTGGIAHDFNNLLAGIIGSLEMATIRVERNDPASIRRYLDAAQGAAQRAATLTQRLLAFSRQQTLKPKPVELDGLVAGVIDIARHSIGPHIEIIRKGDGAWPTLVDPNQLENSLLNLCINARDAMPNGGLLTIETVNVAINGTDGRRYDLAPGNYVCLCVTDTGTGMPADVLVRVFDPFFTTKPLGQGTGLGLSMVYGFAKQSGGHVRLTSKEGQGTTVHLYLPRYRGNVATSDFVASSNVIPGRGEAVLVVDDEAVIRMLISDALEGTGYVGFEAEDAARGLKLLQSGARFDLLITDVGLPGGMNGRQLADAGRALQPGLKVLFITGYAETSVLEGRSLGKDMQILTKPFAIEGLVQKIREMLDS